MATRGKLSSPDELLSAMMVKGTPLNQTYAKEDRNMLKAIEQFNPMRRKKIPNRTINSMSRSQQAWSQSYFKTGHVRNLTRS